MESKSPIYFNDPDALAEFVIERMGMDINVGMVLGLGKPNHFTKPAVFLSNEHMRQNYTSTNYTHACRDLKNNGMNVVAQLLAKREINGSKFYSASCNSDTSLDAFDQMKRRQKKDKPALNIGQINHNLPFMYGDAVVKPETFDAVLEGPEFHFGLFGAPRKSVNTTDHIIGLHASTLIKDGGTLQIGIGSLGDAIAYGLKMRHTQNKLYNDALNAFGIPEKFGAIVDKVGGTNVFDKGLYGCTEMLVDGFLHLYNAGIMKRKVYDNVPLQTLVNENKIHVNQKVTPQILDMLREKGAIHSKLKAKDVAFLKKYGIFKSGLEYKDGQIIDKKEAFTPDLNDPNAKDRIIESFLGTQLADGFWMHAGFFLGPRHLRDIVITEYGIADLISKNDQEVFAAILNITDSRFQQDLLQKAKQVKKIDAGYQIPDRFRNNTPERLEKTIQSFKDQGLFPVFPFGTAFTDEEIVIGKSLREFKEKTAASKASVLPGLMGQMLSSVPAEARPYLERMQLDNPSTRQEKLMQKIVVFALKQAGQI